MSFPCIRSIAMLTYMVMITLLLYGVITTTQNCSATRVGARDMVLSLTGLNVAVRCPVTGGDFGPSLPLSRSRSADALGRAKDKPSVDADSRGGVSSGENPCEPGFGNEIEVRGARTGDADWSDGLRVAPCIGCRTGSAVENDPLDARRTWLGPEGKPNARSSARDEARRETRRDRSSSNACSSAAVKSFGSITARSIATGSPRCRPRSMTTMTTSFESTLNDPENE